METNMTHKHKAHEQVNSRDVEHPVGMLCGVKPGDTKVEAAEKAIATAKMAFGENNRTVKNMEKMLADYKRAHSL